MDIWSSPLKPSVDISSVTSVSRNTFSSCPIAQSAKNTLAYLAIEITTSNRLYWIIFKPKIRNNIKSTKRKHKQERPFSKHWFSPQRKETLLMFKTVIESGVKPN